MWCWTKPRSSRATAWSACCEAEGDRKADQALAGRSIVTTKARVLLGLLASLALGACETRLSSTPPGPIEYRIRRNVGKPTAAVMRRTWRLRPSVRVSASQESGTLAR